MAVRAVKHKKTACQQKNPFEGKTTVIIKVHPWMCTHIFPSLPMLTPQVEPMRETPKADRGTSALWSKLLPSGPTEEHKSSGSTFMKNKN